MRTTLRALRLSSSRRPGAKVQALRSRLALRRLPRSKRAPTAGCTIRHGPPVQGIAARALYLGPGQVLSFEKPALDDSRGASEYTADPAHPIPYRARPVEATYDPGGSHWYEWLAEDQQSATGRADQLCWRTAPLHQTLTLTGDVDADLWAATTGTDADWIVKLIDQYPDDPKLGKMAGYQLMVAEEIFRGRYRESFSHPEAIAANTPLEYQWSLHAIDHAFLPGHRLLVGGAEQLVSPVRPQPAKLRGQHHECQTRGLPRRHPTHFLVEQPSVSPRHSGSCRSLRAENSHRPNGAA